MQLELVWRSEETLQRELEDRTGLRISLVITDNTSTMLSMRHRGKGRTELRLHRMFLAAEPPVLRALAEWLTKRRASRSGSVIDAFIERNCHRIRSGKPRRLLARTQGRYFDLQALFEEVNIAHFESAVDAAVTWGKRPARSRRRRRSIRFGSYTQEDHLIRVHPLLDQDFVPRYIVRYIVFHEMLHAYLGVGVSPSGRRQIHTPEFNALEAAYPDYERSVAWIENSRNLSRLLKPLHAAPGPLAPTPLWD